MGGCSLYFFIIVRNEKCCKRKNELCNTKDEIAQNKSGEGELLPDLYLWVNVKYICFDQLIKPSC